MNFDFLKKNGWVLIRIDKMELLIVFVNLVIVLMVFLCLDVFDVIMVSLKVVYILLKKGELW